MALKKTESKNAEYTKGEQGLAILTCLDRNRVKVKFQESEKVYELNIGTGDERTVPEYVPYRAPVKEETGNIKFFETRINCTMNESGTKIQFASPAQGEFTAHFTKFAVPKEGDIPVATSRLSKRTGKKYNAFNAIVEIRGEKRWNNASYAPMLYPNFGKDEDENLTVTSDELIDFTDCIGLNEGDIKYSENPLPAIEKIAKERDLDFKITVVNGFIVHFMKPIENWEDDEYPEKNSKAVEEKKETHELLQD